jgi:hypothetical protein
MAEPNGGEHSRGRGHFGRDRPQGLVFRKHPATTTAIAGLGAGALD